MDSLTPNPKEEFDALLADAREVPVADPRAGPVSLDLPDEIEREALAFYLRGESPALSSRLRPEHLSPIAGRLLVRLREVRTLGLELRPSVLELRDGELKLFTALSQIQPIRPETFTHHLDLLFERHRRHSLAVIYESLKAQVEGTPEGAPAVPVDAALLAAMRQLEEAVTEHSRDRDPSLAGYDYLAEYRRRPERRPTRFRELNRMMIGGFYSGSMFLLSGEAGAGKTAFLLNLASDYALEGHRVVFFSLEMEAYEIASRLLAYQSKEEIRLSALVNGKVPEITLANLLQNQRQIFSNVIVEQMLADTSVHDLTTRIYEHHITRPSAAGKELVVVIDPFQRLNAGDPDVDRDDITRTRAIAKAIKALSNRLGLITLCTSDTTKEGSSKGGQTAIRGSYEAVHIATTTAHLELDGEQPEEADRRNLTLSITKNRGGLPRGKLSLSFHGETQRFHEIEQDKD